MTQKPVFMEGIFTLRNLRSMGTAAIIEMAIAFGVAGILLWQQLRPIETPQLPPAHPIDFPETPSVLPHTVPTSPQPQTQQLSEVPSVPTDIPGPNVQPLLPPQVPAQPPQTSAGLVAEFGARMLRAINDQKVYPKASLLKGETGETVVSFDYVDGAVSNIRVDRSSGFHDLDAAAVEAVQRAVLPPKPAELTALDHFVFQLEFSLGN